VSAAASVRRALERTGLLLRVKKLYYRAEGRLHRSRSSRLFGHVCGTHSLVFDVGANLGQKTAVFLHLGARVVAIEPERHCFEYVRARFPGNRVTALNVAVSDAPGRARLFVSPQTPEISTLEASWLESGPDKDKAGTIEEQAIEVVTLSQLIERYGVPDYVKIDVEGFETHVLRGLQVPVQHVSFEFHAGSVETIAERCAILSALGRYRFNFTLGNSYELSLPSWLPAPELVERIRALPPTPAGPPQWGDVFARLEPRT
jgi:FkbM family methyltransferase